MRTAFSVLFVLPAIVLSAAVCDSGVGTPSGRARRTPGAATPLAAVTALPTDPALATATVVPATAISPPPAATATAAPPLQGSGWAVYARDNDLYVGRLDGSGERRLTEGAAACACSAAPSSFAGSALVDGRVWLYYVRAIAPIEPPLYALNTIHFALMREPLSGGAAEDILHFDGFVTFEAWSASVSPDGAHVLYAAIDGLHRYDVGPKTDFLLFANVTDCSRLASPGGACKIFEGPLWSPSGERALVDVGAAEGAQAMLFDPLVAPRETDGVTALPVGGRFAHWSPDGRALCMSEDGYAQGAGGYMSLKDHVFHNLTAQLGGDFASATGCAWAQGGSIAFGYARAATSGIAIFGADGSLRRDIALQVHQPIVAGWLPGGSGVVASWGEPDGSSRTGIVLTDGTSRTLPFDADQVLAVLP